MPANRWEPRPGDFARHGTVGNGSPSMERIAVMGACDVEKPKNIAERLTGIKTDKPYAFDAIGTIPKM